MFTIGSHLYFEQLLLDNLKYEKGDPMHETPAIARPGGGQMYTVIPPHVKRLFLYFKPMTFMLQWSNLIAA